MRLVFLKWLDSKGGFRHWMSVEELVAMDCCHCESVGWLIREPGGEFHSYIVAPHVWKDAGTQKVNEGDGAMVIPACAVLEVRELLKLPGVEAQTGGAVDYREEVRDEG